VLGAVDDCTPRDDGQPGNDAATDRVLWRRIVVQLIAQKPGKIIADYTPGQPWRAKFNVSE